MAEESSSTAVMDAPGGEMGEGSTPVVPETTPVVPSPVVERTGPEVLNQPPATPHPLVTPTPTPTPTPTRTPTRTPVETEDNVLNWRNLADPEYRDHPTLRKYTTVAEALKAHVHQQELLGRSITIPREGAGETQWREIHEKLGCPTHIGDYVIQDPDMGTHENGERKTLDAQFLSTLLGVAHEAGLNSKQAQAFVNMAGQLVVRSEQIQKGQAAVERADMERALYEAFGADTASILQKAKLVVANMGSGRYGGGEYAQRAIAKLEASPLGRDPDIQAMLANMWDNVSEGTYHESSTGGGMLSRDTLTADIEALGAIMNDPSKPMAERQAAQAKQLNLYRELNAMNEAGARRGNTPAPLGTGLGMGAWR
jgi:hypothetical protein